MWFVNQVNQVSQVNRAFLFGNVAKSGMDVRGVGLSQTDKTTRSIAHAVEVAPLYSRSGGLGQTATPYVFFPPSQTLPHYLLFSEK